MGKRLKITSHCHEDDPAESKNLKFLVNVVAEVILDLCGGGNQENESWHAELSAMVARTIARDNNNTHKKAVYLIRTAPALWSRYRQGEDSWRILSARGVERVMDSAMEFAERHLLPYIEHTCHQEGWNDVQVDPRSAFIRISRRNNIQVESSLSCPYCPAVATPSIQSLWWHLQTTHEVPHHEAVAMARHQSERNRAAIVLYDPATSASVSNATKGTQGPEQAPPITIHMNDTDSSRNSDCLSPTPSISSSSIPDPWDCARRADGLADLRTHYTATALALLRDAHGALPLHWAAGAGHVETVRFLLTATPVDTPQRGRRAYAGRTALHWAARHGHAALVDYLVRDAHANVEAVTADGTTAVCWAAWQGHTTVVRFLQTVGGANLGTTNRYGCSPLLWAAQGSNSTVELMEWLTDYAPWWQRNHSGHGVLHKAAQRGRWGVCRWFVERWLVNEGAESCHIDVISPDQDGAVPSDLAGMEGHEELARYLADVEMAYVKRCCSTAERRPAWLAEPFAPEPCYVWESGAGVLRMRSVLSRTHERRACEEVDDFREID